MKKLILILSVVCFTTVVKSQTYQVVDSTYYPNERTEIIEGKIKSLQKSLLMSLDKERVEKDTVTYFSETRAFLNYLWKGVRQYEELFIKKDTFQYVRYSVPTYQIFTGQNISFDYFENGDSLSQGLIHEYDSLTVRISDLRAGADTITYLYAIEQFNKIQERKAILENRYIEIKAQ